MWLLAGALSTSCIFEYLYLYYSRTWDVTFLPPLTVFHRHLVAALCALREVADTYPSFIHLVITTMSLTSMLQCMLYPDSILSLSLPYSGVDSTTQFIFKSTGAPVIFEVSSLSYCILLLTTVSLWLAGCFFMFPLMYASVCAAVFYSVWSLGKYLVPLGHDCLSFPIFRVFFWIAGVIVWLSYSTIGSSVRTRVTSISISATEVQVSTKYSFYALHPLSPLGIAALLFLLPMIGAVITTDILIAPAVYMVAAFLALTYATTLITYLYTTLHSVVIALVLSLFTAPMLAAILAVGCSPFPSGDWLHSSGLLAIVQSWLVLPVPSLGECTVPAVNDDQHLYLSELHGFSAPMTQSLLSIWAGSESANVSCADNFKMVSTAFFVFFILVVADFIFSTSKISAWTLIPILMAFATKPFFSVFFIFGSSADSLNCDALSYLFFLLLIYLFSTLLRRYLSSFGGPILLIQPIILIVACVLSLGCAQLVRAIQVTHVQSIGSVSLRPVGVRLFEPTASKCSLLITSALPVAVLLCAWETSLKMVVPLALRMGNTILAISSSILGAFLALYILPAYTANFPTVALYMSRLPLVQSIAFGALVQTWILSKGFFHYLQPERWLVPLTWIHTIVSTITFLAFHGTVLWSLVIF